MTDFTLEGFRLVLETTGNLPGISAVPFLHEASSIALRILNIVRDVRSQNQAFNDLASDACGLVYTVVVECQNMNKDGREVPERVQIHIAHLARNLAAIERFTRKKIDRATLKKFILRSKDLEEIKRYRELLRQSLDVFGIQANISIQDNLQRISDSIERQKQELKTDRAKHEDGQKRVEEELASHLETLRMQQEEREARLQKEMEDILRQERETFEREMKREERKWKDGTRDDGRSDTAKSPEPENISQGRKKHQSSHWHCYPTGEFYPPFFYPASPYLYPGFPYTIPTLPSVTTINGGAKSLTESTVHVTSYNSGNVTNTVIKNSMNSYPVKKKYSSKNANDSNDDSENDLSDSDVDDDWFHD